MTEKTTRHDERSDLAAYIFPREWAAIATKPGASKARQKYRKYAEDVIAMDVLRASGRSCATCDSFRKVVGIGMTCEAESDFHGYQLAKADNVCLLWQQKSLP